MNMKSFRALNKAEDGAVTVDWVVLTAAVVGLGIAAVGVVRSGLKTGANTASSGAAGASVQTTF